jgi:hypothetical protein
MSALIFNGPTDAMLVEMHVDSPEFPVNRYTRAHRQVQLEVLQSICASFAEISGHATHWTDRCHRHQSTEPQIDEPKRACCLARTIRGEPAGLDPLRTNVNPEAEF